MNEELPPKEVIIKKVKEYLDTKDYENAAKVILYYSFCKIGPEEFSRRLFEAVEKYRESHSGDKVSSS